MATEINYFDTVRISTIDQSYYLQIDNDQCCDKDNWVIIPKSILAHVSHVGRVESVQSGDDLYLAHVGTGKYFSGKREHKWSRIHERVRWRMCNSNSTGSPDAIKDGSKINLLEGCNHYLFSDLTTGFESINDDSGKKDWIISRIRNGRYKEIDKLIEKVDAAEKDIENLKAFHGEQLISVATANANQQLIVSKEKESEIKSLRDQIDDMRLVHNASLLNQTSSVPANDQIADTKQMVVSKALFIGMASSLGVLIIILIIIGIIWCVQRCKESKEVISGKLDARDDSHAIDIEPTLKRVVKPEFQAMDKWKSIKMTNKAESDEDLFNSVDEGTGTGTASSSKK